MNPLLKKAKQVVIKNLISRRKCYQLVKDTKEGDRVFSDIYRFCGVHKPSFIQGDPHSTAYNEGLKAVARHIQGVLKQSDEEVVELIKTYNQQ